MIKEKKVMSATKFNLFFSIFLTILFVISESIATIVLFKIEHSFDKITLFVLTQILCLICIKGAYDFFIQYKNRKEFIVYASKLTSSNIDNIKQDYHICTITANGIVYVRKEDMELFTDYQSLNGIIFYEEFDYKVK